MEADPMKLASEIYHAVVSGQWWLAASFAVVLVVWALRTWGSKLFPKLAPFLAHPLVAFAMPVLVSAAGAVTNALVTGLPVKDALLAGLKVAAGAVFAYVFTRKVAEAAKAGEAAAAAVDSPEAAVAIINKGPQP